MLAIQQLNGSAEKKISRNIQPSARVHTHTHTPYKCINYCCIHTVCERLFVSHTHLTINSSQTNTCEVCNGSYVTFKSSQFCHCLVLYSHFALCYCCCISTIFLILYAEIDISRTESRTWILHPFSQFFLLISFVLFFFLDSIRRFFGRIYSFI